MIKTPKHELSKPLIEEHLKEGVLNCTIPHSSWDTIFTSNAGIIGDPFVQTDDPSKKIFALSDGNPAAGSNVAKLYHNVCDPAHTVDMVPALAYNSILRRRKFADSGYVSICYGNKVNFYDKQSVKITVSEEAVLKGWRCPYTSLWRIPLQIHITNLIPQTLLLNVTKGINSKNERYVVPNTAVFLEQMNLFTQEPAHPPQTDKINNVYELPIIGRAVWYLHAASGFPTKVTWMKAIHNGNYLSWPLINVQNMSKHFPESEETPKEHLRNQRQGIRSTKSRLAEQTNDYKTKVK